MDNLSLPNPDSIMLKSLFITYGMKVIGALVILIVGMIVISIVKRSFRSIFEKRKIDVTLEKYTMSSVSFLLWTFVLLAVISKFGVEVGPIIAGLGVFGIAIGFALQGSLSNFASGILLVLLKPFKVGDVVDAAGKLGVVKELGLIACTFTTPDNKMILIPNSKIFGEVITNVTAYETRRVDFTVGIGYGSNIDQAREVCLNIVNDHPKALTDPVPVVFVSELADSSINLTFRVWSKTSDYWDLFFDVNEKIKKELDNAKIEIPFPQRVVWMHQEN